MVGLEPVKSKKPYAAWPTTPFSEICGSRRLELRYSRKLIPSASWRIDNSNFFAIDNFATVKDEVLYEQLLEEFKDWLEQAKNKGILELFALKGAIIA